MSNCPKGKFNCISIDLPLPYSVEVFSIREKWEENHDQETIQYA